MVYLHVREKWVSNLGYWGHQTKQFAEDILNKLTLAENMDTSNIVLGKLVHTKNFIPFIPRYSFKDGAQYDFKKRDITVKEISKSNVKVTLKHIAKGEHTNVNMLNAIPNVECKVKLLNENRENFCDDNCISPSENAVLQLKACLEKCSKISYKAFREVIEKFDYCANDPDVNAFYRLNRKPRNHPSECYPENSNCKSELVLLRNNAVHSSNIRKFYDKLNRVKQAHNFLSDLDASLVLKDMDYLIKLVRYMPLVKSKVVENVEHTSCIVNEDTVTEKYGDHHLQYRKYVKNLTQITCVSCEILVRPTEAKLISSRRRKLDNSKFTELKQYLCSEKRESLGKEKVDSIVNKYLCNYCNTKLNNNESPRVSVINGFDAGQCPKEISKLNIFSLLFIKIASSFQKHLKLGPVQSKIPENQKMAGVRGNSIQLPIPIQNTIDELESNLSQNKLLDVGKYLVIYNYNKGKNGKVMYKNLVNIHDIKAALVWLKSNNPNYTNIEIPINAEELFPCENHTSTNLSLNEKLINNNIGSVSNTDSVTEFITQNVYYDGVSTSYKTHCGDDGECVSDEMITQDVCFDGDSESMCDEMITQDVCFDGDSEGMCDEMVTQDVCFDGDSEGMCDEMVTQDVCFDGDSEGMCDEMVTQDVCFDGDSEGMCDDMVTQDVCFDGDSEGMCDEMVTQDVFFDRDREGMCDEMTTHDVYYDNESEIEGNVDSSNGALITQDAYIAGSNLSSQKDCETNGNCVTTRGNSKFSNVNKLRDENNCCTVNDSNSEVDITKSVDSKLIEKLSNSE